MDVSGRERLALIHMPARVRGASQPLVVMLHGGGGNGAQFMESSGFVEYADEFGLIAAFPYGTGPFEKSLLTWNAGNCCGRALDEGVDDVAFIRALVQTLVDSYGVDPRRVYAAGISNGAMMSYRLACDASDVFRGIAPVAGALNLSPCRALTPVSLMAIHGTADRHVLYDGGAPEVRADRRHDRVDTSVSESVGFWVDRNACSANARVSVQGTVRHDIYANCREGRTVELFTIDGGTHSWPGGTRGWIGGDEPSQAISASRLIAEFASRP
ncbi:MAG: prolyl oligopeptidase family serine peptidase [Spirochaetales bacterium]|nr:prolyl oligopeptidase family serine peptidase [Leptospiraceae bacterium]MCP5481166.1 prolyl oligopeptidase family serine peptidase [Spirochaetales bacterium]